MRTQLVRQNYFRTLFYAFILNNIIFLLIILLSFSVSQYNYQSISKENNIINQYLKELDSLSMQTNCNDSRLIEASQKLDEVGFKLNLLETRLGKKDYRTLEQKELYVALELKHFELVKKIEQECKKEFVKIMFIYSNEKPYDKASESMGFVITTFKNNAPEKVMVYSFDYNLDTPEINQIKTKYLIDNAPVVVINEETSLVVKDIEDLERYSQ